MSNCATCPNRIDLRPQLANMNFKRTPCCGCPDDPDGYPEHEQLDENKNYPRLKDGATVKPVTELLLSDSLDRTDRAIIKTIITSGHIPSQSEIAQHVHVDRSTVTRRIANIKRAWSNL